MKIDGEVIELPEAFPGHEYFKSQVWCRRRNRQVSDMYVAEEGMTFAPRLADSLASRYHDRVGLFGTSPRNGKNCKVCCQQTYERCKSNRGIPNTHWHWCFPEFVFVPGPSGY